MDRIPSAQRWDSLAALRARVDSVPVPLTQVEGMPPDVPALRLPRVFPAFMAAYAPPDGRIWVRRWSVGTAARTIFDVFDSNGRLRVIVELPRAIAVAPTPALALDGVAAVAIDPETGTHMVVRFVSPLPR